MISIFQNRQELFHHILSTDKITNFLEVGVRDGDNIKFILKYNLPSIVGIDMRYSDTVGEIAINNNNFDYIISLSTDAIELFSDNFFDIIYIDAGHSYKNVKEDLNGWWPKLKKGGYLIGDDYCFVNNIVEGVYGVVDAVEEFINQNNIDDLYVTEIGYTNKETRLNFAKTIGKKIEDNNWIIHKYLVPNLDMSDRTFTEKTINIPQFLIKK